MTAPGKQLTPGDEPAIGDPPLYGDPDGAYVGEAAPGSPNALSDLNSLNESEIKRRQREPVEGSFYRQRDALVKMLSDVAFAITGETPAGDPLKWVEEWLSADRANTGAVLVDYGNALAQKVEPWAVPTVAPLSSTINRRADATFQLSDFMTPAWSGQYRDDYGDNYGTTTRTLANSAVTRSLQQGFASKGRTYFAFLTPAINRAYDRLSFMVDAVTNPCRMDIAVYVVNPEDRSMNRQIHVTNAALPLGRDVATVQFSETWVATQGSYLAVAFLQHGDGNARQLLGLFDTPRPLPNFVYPRKISAVHTDTGMVNVPETIDGENRVDFNSVWFTPYAELSEDIGPNLRVFQDSFTTKNGREIERPWVTVTSRAAWVHSGGYVTVPGGLIVYNGPRCALYDSPLSTDRVQSTMRLLRQSEDDPDSWSFMALRTSNNMSVGVGVFVKWGRAEIRSWTGPKADDIYTLSVTRAAVDFDMSRDRTLTATWVDGEVAVYDETNRAILSWRDNVTQKIARHRFVGIGVQRNSGRPSPRIDEWATRDLPIDEGEGSD